MIDCGTGQSPVRCTVIAISKGGARLSVLNPESIPDAFTLSFASGMAVQRRCIVVSRGSREVVVEMLWK
jgi:hypothetical protein